MKITKFIPDEIYKEIMQSMPVPTVDVVIFTADMKQTLLFYRENKPIKHIYATMGGRLYKNESFEECALRKIQEELGLEIEKGDLTFGGSLNEIFEDSAFEGVNAHTVNNYFFIRVNKETFATQFDAQHSQAKWFSIADESLHPFMKERVRLCLEKHNS